MIDELRKRTTVSAILLIGLFTFIFLGAEYLYVNMIALTAEARKAVNAQNYALGVSVAGFLLYPALSRLVKRQYQGIITLALALACLLYTSVEWVKGTRLRPYLEFLGEKRGEEFENEIVDRAKKIYPARKSGEVVLGFRRFFFTAEK